MRYLGLVVAALLALVLPSRDTLVVPVRADDHVAVPRADYIVMPRAELMALPTSGAAWNYVVAVANSTWMRPNLQDQDGLHGVETLAAALIYARTRSVEMRTKARNALLAAIDTLGPDAPLTDSGLGPYRQISAYILVADLIRLTGTDETTFRSWLTWALNNPLGTHSRWGHGVKFCHEDANNNWGGWCGSTRIAGDVYLGDTADLAVAANVVRGFYGDRRAWSQFQYQEVAAEPAIQSWACDGSPAGFLPVNPSCVKDGINLDGAVPADISRTATSANAFLQWPPTDQGKIYTAEVAAGYLLQTELLYRSGYSDAYTWGNNALKRMGELISRGSFWNLGGVQHHVPWLLNERYSTSFPTLPAGYGRAFGYTDWLYGG